MNPCVGMIGFIWVYLIINKYSIIDFNAVTYSIGEIPVNLKITT